MCVYIYTHTHTISIYSSVDEYLGCFHILSIVNSAMKNTEVHVSYRITVLSNFMPTSGIERSYSHSIFSFLNSFHTLLRLIWKDPDAGRDWGQKEKGAAEDKMDGWHHRLNGHGFGWTLGVGGRQGGLACCSSWGHKKLDTTERLNWTELNSSSSCASFHSHQQCRRFLFLHTVSSIYYL